jgi:hypothetical protein
MFSRYRAIPLNIVLRMAAVSFIMLVHRLGLEPQHFDSNSFRMG